MIFPTIDYDELVDAMFHMIRQNPAGSAAVLIRIVEVLTAVIGYERDPGRMAVLRRHADLVLASYFVILRGSTFTIGDRISMGGVRGDVLRLGFIQTTIVEMGQLSTAQGGDSAMWVVRQARPAPR